MLNKLNKDFEFVLRRFQKLAQSSANSQRRPGNNRRAAAPASAQDTLPSGSDDDPSASSERRGLLAADQEEEEQARRQRLEQIQMARATQENVVEREGLSVRHPAKFVLIGSGNPEEGELRPQLLDRFGLSVEVRTPQDIETRVEIMRRCARQEADAEGFAAEWADEEDAVLKRIDRGRKRVAKVDVPDAMLTKVAELCMAVGADGLRGELTVMRAARALAALAGAKKVGEAHLIAVAPSALRHRLRRDVLDETGSAARIERAIAEVF